MAECVNLGTSASLQPRQEVSVGCRQHRVKCAQQQAVFSVRDLKAPALKDTCRSAQPSPQISAPPAPFSAPLWIFPFFLFLSSNTGNRFTQLLSGCINSIVVLP